MSDRESSTPAPLVMTGADATDLCGPDGCLLPAEHPASRSETPAAEAVDERSR